MFAAVVICVCVRVAYPDAPAEKPFSFTSRSFLGYNYDEDVMSI